MKKTLEGKNILITGATSGIGKATALWILDNTGANVFIVGRNTETLYNICKTYVNRCFAIVYDLNDLEHIGSIFKKIDVRLDAFFHCAGKSPLMKVEENDLNTMRETFNINYFSFMELCKYFYKDCNSNYGSSIVAMSSIATSVASFRQSVYSSTKAALEQTVRCMAKEFLPRKIRVNGIAAGAVKTEMLSVLENNSEGLHERLLNYYPLGLISPEEIAKVVVHLFTDETRHIDGTILQLDSAFFINK